MIRVLIVDDDFMVAKVHAGFVGALAGFEVVGSAATGAAALEEVGRLRPDLVLLDVYLPDMTGLEVLRRLRAQGRTTRTAAGEGGLSATECSERTGLARVSARRYLEQLVTVGEADVRQRYGTAGRPERRFSMRGGRR